MDNISIGFAFLAGMLSFLSPCVLPLVPGYLSFLSGLSFEELKSGADHKKVVKKATLTSFFFVLGFSIVFISMGASASFIGKFLTAHMGIITKIAGILIIALGLHLIGILKVSWLNTEKRFEMKRFSSSPLSALVIGFAFAFGWTPCIGPILAGILTLAATQDTIWKGMALLSAYSLGLGIPFIITGFGVGIFMRFFEQYKRFIRTGQIVSGLLLITIGILIFTNNLTTLLRFVPEFFYKFAQ